MNQDRAMFRFRLHFAALAFAMTSAACNGAVAPADTANDVNSTASLSKETDGGTTKSGKVCRNERAPRAVDERPRGVKGARRRDDADGSGEASADGARKVKRGGIGHHPDHVPPPGDQDEPGPPPDDANEPGAPPPPSGAKPDRPHGDGAPPPPRGPGGPVLVHPKGEPPNEPDGDDDCDDAPQPPTSSDDCEDDALRSDPSGEGSRKTPH